MFERQVKRALMIVGGAIVVSCDGADDPLSPGDYLGQYALVQVNGKDLGWYHQLGAVDCTAAFTSGSLIMTRSPHGVEQFQFRLDYNYRCLGIDPYDGTDVLVVVGTEIKADSDFLVLNGIGPDLIGGTSHDKWSLDVRPRGEDLEVRIYGLNGQFWGDPVFVMGPRVAYDGPCFIGC